MYLMIEIAVQIGIVTVRRSITGAWFRRDSSGYMVKEADPKRPMAEFEAVRYVMSICNMKSSKA